MLVSPGDWVDIVQFTGPDARRVADIQVTVQSVQPVDDAPGSPYVDAKPVNAAGADVTPGELNVLVLTNPNETPVTVGVVCLIWDNSHPGAPSRPRVSSTSTTR